MNQTGAGLMLRRFLAFMARYVSPAGFAAGTALLITFIALFTPPYIGMADNGDFFRVLYSNGLYFHLPDYDSQYLGYFIKEFGILQYYNENVAIYYSSQSLLIQLALALNKLFVSTVIFDVRVQSAILTLLFIVAIYLLVESLTWKMKPLYGYIIAVLAVFMFADTAYTAFFNSFFSESIVLIMVILTFASGLLLYRRRYNDYAMVAALAISGLLLTTSKQQNAPVGIILAATCLFLLLIRKEKKFKVIMFSTLSLLFFSGIATYALIPKEFVNINQYHAMTRGILLGSDDPERALEKMGVNKQYAILKNSIYYEPFTTVDVNSHILEKYFYSQYGFGEILGYYVSHPKQAISMLDLAAKNAFTIRPPAMGNYEKEEGKPFGQQTTFFSGYSLLKKALAPKTFGFIVIWIAVVTGVYMPSFVTALQRRDFRNALRFPFIFSMILMGLSGIFVSIIGAGDADLSKHEFLFTVTFDLVTFVVISDAIRRRLWQRDSRLDSEPE
jgi:hypothetical protein